jgi:hypothetical protein
MGRVTVWVPDDLEAAVRAGRPGLNWSARMQAGLRDALRCEHRGVLRCVVCDELVERSVVELDAVDRFVVEELHDLEPLVFRGGTAEGACRVLAGTARRWGCPMSVPLPRPTRAERERNAWAACHTLRVR